jgi:hypothetical protein
MLTGRKTAAVESAFSCVAAFAFEKQFFAFTPA